MNETTTRHPILDMLGLSDEWKVEEDPAVLACSCGHPHGRHVVGIYHRLGTQGLTFCEDGYLEVHSLNLHKPGYARLLDAVGIELHECLSIEEPCGDTEGKHQMWTWRKVVAS